MILDTVKKILDYTEADGYELTDTVTVGWEFYFIRHKLDQNRAKEVEHINVRIFKKIEDGKYLGSASGEVPPTASKEEAEKIINDLVYRAGLVRNAPYELNKGTAVMPLERPKISVEDIAADFIQAMERLPETSGEDINSYEIFVSDVTKTIINSEGVNVSYEYPSSMIEVVVNARRDGHEIELYRSYLSGTCDQGSLVQDLSAVLRYGKDKLAAQPTPDLKEAPVVFSTADAATIYRYFTGRLRTSSVYQGLSDWKLGVPVAPDAQGDKVTIYGVHELPNSSFNYPFDSEGAIIRDRCLIKENVPENYWGERQFSQYLGLKESSIIYNFKVSGGTASAAELRKGRYLEIVEFSDFQVDVLTGNIAGEIRLGYYHDGGKTTIVSGGSVSGRMAELAKEFRMSREARQYNNYLIPEVTRIEHVHITGSGR